MTNEEAIAALKEKYCGIGSNDLFVFRKAIEALENAEKEIKHGHWIKDPENGETRCSECDWSLETAWESNYCPDCGAKMYDA